MAEDLHGRVRCPVCGRYTARVVPSVPPKSLRHMPSMPPLEDLGREDSEPWAGRPLQLRRGEREFRVRDLDRLRRLVVQRKAAASDLVSADGVSWVPLSSLEPLEPYFAVVRMLEGGGFTAGGGTLVEATSAELGWGDDEPVVEVTAEAALECCEDGIEEIVPRRGPREHS
jgi:hypothetical protein